MDGVDRVKSVVKSEDVRDNLEHINFHEILYETPFLRDWEMVFRPWR